MIIDFSKYKVRITDKSVNEVFAEKVKIHKIIEYVQDKINTAFKKALCEELENIRKKVDVKILFFGLDILNLKKKGNIWLRNIILIIRNV